MTDRSIIFSGPMVSALLEGRKTQTRRLLKLNGRFPDFCGPSGNKHDPTCWGWEDAEHGDWITLEKDAGQRMGWRDWVGAYQVGDRLYVREAFAYVGSVDPGWLLYRANYDDCCIQHGFDKPYPPESEVTWKPSIHMPRKISRLTLTVTDVRLQRLQDISGDDAIAEGCRPFFDENSPEIITGPNGREHEMLPLKGPQDDFRRLWDSLNAKRAPWDSNPWIAALTFDVVKGNIDG